ncbi:MAG: hypothetical protein PHQ27_09470 [Victivallales bacterium]|nr:hypothetical protein [Victivallales bacterium]
MNINKIFKKNTFFVHETAEIIGEVAILFAKCLPLQAGNSGILSSFDRHTGSRRRRQGVKAGTMVMPSVPVPLVRQDGFAVKFWREVGPSDGAPDMNRLPGKKKNAVVGAEGSCGRSVDGITQAGSRPGAVLK